MNMPRFTAEASLYKTSGHYRTGRQAINSPTKMIGPIHLAVIDVPGETVVIVEKWPPDPWEPPWIGGTGPGTPVPSPGGSEGGGGGPGGGVGGSPMTPPKKPPRPVPPAPPPLNDGCTYDQRVSEAGISCQQKIYDDVHVNKVKNPHYLLCEGSKMMCCQNHPDHITICDHLNF